MCLLLFSVRLCLHAVYDVTRRETFESLEDIWVPEVNMYSTVEDAVKMVVANKLDLVSTCCGAQPGLVAL